MKYSCFNLEEENFSNQAVFNVPCAVFLAELTLWMLVMAFTVTTHKRIFQRRSAIQYLEAKLHQVTVKCVLILTKICDA